MISHKISLLTNMVAPYRVPFFKELAAQNGVYTLRILVCTEREVDRQWKVDQDNSYVVKILSGITLNMRKRNFSPRIIHLRFGIFWELLANRPDILIIGDASWTSYFAVLACKILHIKYIVWNEITTSSQVTKGIYSHLRRWMYRGAKSLVASCGMARDFLMANNVDKSKIKIIRNTVDNEFYINQRTVLEPRRAMIRSDLGVSNEIFCFIFVGQLISRKRVLETVNLIANAAQVKPLHLLVVGEGPLEEQMRICAKDKKFNAITFCGYVDAELLSKLYVASDALILLSDDEPWGMVVNEAILMGKPYLTTANVAAGVEFSSLCSQFSYYSCDIMDIDVVKFAEKNNRQVNVDLETPKDMAEKFLLQVVS